MQGGAVGPAVTIWLQHDPRAPTPCAVPSHRTAPTTGEGMPRGRIYDDITGTMGDTRLIYLRHLAKGLPARVAVKHEGFNPFSSVKDRIGVAMLSDAIERGVLKPGMTIVEPTSGNTGIG